MGMFDYFIFEYDLTPWGLEEFQNKEFQTKSFDDICGMDTFILKPDGSLYKRIFECVDLTEEEREEYRRERYQWHLDNSDSDPIYSSYEDFVENSFMGKFTPIMKQTGNYTDTLMEDIHGDFNVYSYPPNLMLRFTHGKLEKITRLDVE